MSLKVTRAILDAIHSGELDRVETEESPIFGLHVPTSCPGVETRILNPKNTWSDKNAYDKTLRKLGEAFV